MLEAVVTLFFIGAIATTLLLFAGRRGQARPQNQASDSSSHLPLFVSTAAHDGHVHTSDCSHHDAGGGGSDAGGGDGGGGGGGD